MNKVKFLKQTINMKNYHIIFLVISLVLFGCGRDEFAYIKNETGKPVIIELGLNNINNDPTKYLIADALNGNVSSNEKYDGIDNYFVSYDSLTNKLTLKLDINEKLKLGTVRLDMTRDSIKYWEFNSIVVRGDGINIQAKGDNIMNLIEKRTLPFSQHSHDLLLK